MTRNYDAWKIEPLEGSVSCKKLLEHLVGWGILAPSTHNTQPWKMRIFPSDGRIDVCLDERFVLPESDGRGRQSVISVGCALQNIALAAEAYHLRFAVDFSPDMAAYPLPLVSFRLEDACGSYALSGDPEFLSAMKTRSMNRNEYDPTKPIAGVVMDRIIDIVRNMGLEVHVVTDMSTILAVSSFQYMADSAVIMKVKFRNELAGFFLPNDSGKGRGMPGATFGLDNAAASAVKRELEKAGPVNPGQMAGFALSGRNGVRSSPAIFVVSVPEDAPRQWLIVGMAFEKAALIAEMNGLSIAVHAATVEVGLANRMLKLRLGSTGRPAMLFRMGYANCKMPHAPRLPVDEVAEVINEDRGSSL